MSGREDGRVVAEEEAVPAGAPLIGAPLLADLMPWSVPPLRIGRAWPLAPDAATLRARWDVLVRTADPAAREALFRPSRARGLHTTVPRLPGHAAPTGPLAREGGPCPEPVRVLHGPFDRQWLIPDQRLIDAARTELWRVADERQLYAVELGHVAPATNKSDPGPPVVFSALLPDGRSPAARPGRIRPLYRRPGGREPNVAPGLLDLLADLLALPVTAEDVLAWAAAVATRRPEGCAVPLTRSPELWQEGVALGRRALWLHTHGDRCAPPPGSPGDHPKPPRDRPKLPGGRRPYVRAAIPTGRGSGLPGAVHHDPGDEALYVGEGRISPVPAGAWDFHAGGVRVLEHWFGRRTAEVAPGSLEAVRPAVWPQEWTSELLELITVLALLDELRPARRALTARVAAGARLTAAELRRAGVLPAPPAARGPASVLDHDEEGPNGQFALL